jgi:uncharacterized membrane protein
MRSSRPTPERLGAFSDGVFAVLITIMVLDLKPPRQASFSALVPLWPTALSYGVSYFFIAIVWVNHHHLLRFAEHATERLIWWNFGHLFLVSLVPFSTAWVANTHFAAAAVSIYAGVFVLVNLAYLAFAWEVLAQAKEQEIVSVRVRQMTQARSFVTLGMFVLATIISLWFPLWGFALICCILFAYLKPEGLTRRGSH